MKLFKNVLVFSIATMSVAAHASYGNDYFGCGILEKGRREKDKLTQLADEKGRTIVPVSDRNSSGVLARVTASIETMVGENLDFEVELRDGEGGMIRIENKSKENIFRQVFPKVFENYTRGWKEAYLLTEYDGRSYREEGYSSKFACYRGEKEALNKFFAESDNW